jgi:dipeptidyl aminopeptidase/acylaminoacyl peptidase
VEKTVKYGWQKLGSMFVAILVCAGVSAQQPQANPEIFLAQLTLGATPSITGLKNITNNPGYDSQPSFLPDGSGVLFSSVRGGTQYDIYKYDFKTQQVVQVTRTDDNENSPLVTPDGKTFSVIRSEIPIGAENQRLWRFNLDGSNPSVVLRDSRRIGYHVWVDATHLALYVLPASNSEPNTLQYADTKTGKGEVIETQIGRSLLLRPKTGTVTFVSQPRGAQAVVKEFDPKTRKVTTIVDAVSGSMNRDCVWYPSGVLLMSGGTKVFAWTPGTTSWVEVADLGAEVTNITRMAVSPDGRGVMNGSLNFALVAEPVKK